MNTDFVDGTFKSNDDVKSDDETDTSVEDVSIDSSCATVGNIC